MDNFKTEHRKKFQKNYLVLAIAVAITILILVFSISSLGAPSSDKPQIIQHINSNTEIQIEIANTPSERAKGLMFRPSLGEKSGMLFIFEDSVPRNFWMKNTLIPLDIIYLDENLRVINIHKNTKTNQTTETYPSEGPSRYVLEVNGGFSDRYKIEINDQFLLKEMGE